MFSLKLMHVHIKIHIFCFYHGSKLICGLVSKFKQQFSQARLSNLTVFVIFIDNVTGFFSKNNIENREVGGHILSISNIDPK